MSDQNSYEKLGVPEGATFEEIQAARDHLLESYVGNPQQIAAVEAAYDAVLMDRLRLRQEGKIKVPDRIRFPEKITPAAPSSLPTNANKAAGWLQNILDRPHWVDIMLPAGIMTALGALIIATPTPATLQLAMAASTGSALYFLFRKDRKLGRAVLLGLGGLVLGFAIGGVLYGPLAAQFPALALLGNEVFVSLVTFVVLWLVSSFLK